jgi:hypothetical protein
MKVGDKLYDLRGKLWHVRGFVDDQVVLRTWSPCKGWVYSVEWVECFEGGRFPMYFRVKP